MADPSWFYVDNGQQRGPVAAEDLAAWIRGARLPRDVPVWREGLAQWTPAETRPEIASHLQAEAFYVMTPAGPQGPVDPGVVLEWARAGHVGRETLVWKPGLPEWIAAGAVPELAASLPRIRETTVREAQPEVDRDGPCPLCGSDKKMGKRARMLYGVWICRRCSNGLLNRRHLAYVLDVLAWYLVFTIAMVVLLTLLKLADVTPPPALLAVPYLFFLLFLFKDGFGGYSPGKILTGIRVVDVETGRGAGFGASFKRNLPLLIPFVPLIVAYQLTTGPRWGDGWASTRVVWKKHLGRGPF
jgi:uncharacterized RDD family membrane protein YckC